MYPHATRLVSGHLYEMEAKWALVGGGLGVVDGVGRLQRNTWGRCHAARVLIRACASMYLCVCQRNIYLSPCVLEDVVEQTPEVECCGD